MLPESDHVGVANLGHELDLLGHLGAPGGGHLGRLDHPEEARLIVDGLVGGTIGS